MKLRIIFFGTPAFVIPILHALSEQFYLVSVVTAPDQKVGRKQIMTPSPVKVFGQEHHIPVLHPEKLTPEFVSELTRLTPDLFVVAAFGKIISQRVLDIPRFGAINVHPSRLPKYRGASPLQETLLHGDRESTVTIIQMDAAMDHGPILAAYPFTVASDDTFASLADKTFALAAEKLPETIEKLVKNELTPVEQAHEQATFCGHVTSHDGFFEITNPPTPEHLDQMIRAYYPWPNAWTIVRIKGQETRLKFLPQGTVQLEGKKPVTLKELYNGYPELKEILLPLLNQEA